MWRGELAGKRARFARSRKKADETDAEYEARSWKDEAEAREAVMTFILGLVAEPVPLKHVSLPKGDRLAEVKGRQVLDKFNCNGCHLIRSGTFDFNVSPETTKKLVCDEIAAGRLRLHAWWFDLAGADVHAWEPELGRFTLIDEAEAERILIRLG